MKVLVTGAAGFIGSHVCEGLIKAGHEVVGIDNFVTGSWDNIGYISENVGGSRFVFETRDLTNRYDVEDLFTCHKFDVVCHQAALGSVPRSIEKPYDTFKNNVKAFEILIEEMEKVGVRNLVYASSSSVYGDTPEKVKHEDMAQGKNPLSPYAMSKRINEMQASAWSKTFGFKTIGLRYFNIFGPRQRFDSDYAAVIPKWIYASIKDQPIPIFGDGSQTRDFTYVTNAVEANVLAVHKIQSISEPLICNIGCAQGVSLMEILNNIGSQLKMTHAKLQNLGPRRGDIQSSVANIDRASVELGYRAQVDYKKGLQEAIKWSQWVLSGAE